MRSLRWICGVLVGMLSINTALGQVDSNEVSGTEVNAGLTQRLWENRISVPDPTEDTKAKEDLRNLIQQVRGLRFERNEATPSFSSSTDVAPRPEPDRSSRATDRQPIVTTPSEVEKLADLLQDPNRVPNPLEAAELLFLSGHPVEAIPFYEKALTQTARADMATSTDRAWILFQLGNCLRETDMTKTRDMYQRLISEYPNSPWTELARAHGRLITWHLTAKPELLVAPVEPE